MGPNNPYDASNPPRTLTDFELTERNKNIYKTEALEGKNIWRNNDLLVIRPNSQPLFMCVKCGSLDIAKKHTGYFSGILADWRRFVIGEAERLALGKIEFISPYGNFVSHEKLVRHESLLRNREWEEFAHKVRQIDDQDRKSNANKSTKLFYIGKHYGQLCLCNKCGRGFRFWKKRFDHSDASHVIMGFMGGFPTFALIHLGLLSVLFVFIVYFSDVHTVKAFVIRHFGDGIGQNFLGICLIFMLLPYVVYNLVRNIMNRWFFFSLDLEKIDENYLYLKYAHPRFLGALPVLPSNE